MTGLFCPKCGKRHKEEEHWNQKLEKFESVLVCADCGYTFFIEMYRHKDLMDS